eukprot:g16406.t2
MFALTNPLLLMMSGPGRSHSYHQATIAQSDLCGFTQLASDRTPEEVVEFVKDLFGRFDILTDRFNVYKVETVGDAYIAGMAEPPLTAKQSPIEVVKFGMAMIEATARWAENLGVQELAKCIHRFPAAMFAWQVVYNGQSVFHEKPVFICFPENVRLHWSTTLPIAAADLTEDDNLEIMVQMSENPMLSLILYYFSADLKTTVAVEDWGAGLICDQEEIELSVTCRVGVHHGQCVGGVVGKGMQRYHLFGNFMSQLDTLEATSREGITQISSACKDLRRLIDPDAIVMERLGRKATSEAAFETLLKDELRCWGVSFGAIERSDPKLTTSKGEEHDYEEVLDV